MTIVPDTKDWTWVLDRRCAECGFDAAALDSRDVADVLRTNARSWRYAFAAIEDPTRRPSEDVWSPLEYACHVRDVFQLYQERLALMLAEDHPTFPNWDQDATAVDDRYNEQDPLTVVDELEAAGEQLADSFGRITDDEWSRPGTRSDGARFTVDTFARYMVHDPVHHLHDIGG